MIQNIIFDFGGVILKHEASLMEDIISEIFSIPKVQALDIWKKAKPKVMVGKVSSREFLKETEKVLQSGKSLDELLSLWRKFYQMEAEEVDWKLLEFIESLKERYKVYLLTDTIDTNDEYNLERGIYSKFTRVFRSNIEGFTKHTDQAFLNLLTKIEAKAEECLFIDDLEDNI